jgi:hypothetical protein
LTFGIGQRGITITELSRLLPAVIVLGMLPASCFAQFSFATFEDGSTYAAAPVRGGTDQPLGRIHLIADGGTPEVTRLDVSLGNDARARGYPISAL